MPDICCLALVIVWLMWFLIWRHDSDWKEASMASRVIYKYPIPLQDSFELELPYDANICLFAAQGAHVRLWIEHSAANTRRMVTRRFRLFGTGHTFEGDGLAHVGSVVAGSFVWHLYEELV